MGANNTEEETNSKWEGSRDPRTGRLGVGEFMKAKDWEELVGVVEKGRKSWNCKHVRGRKVVWKGSGGEVSARGEGRGKREETG